MDRTSVTEIRVSEMFAESDLADAIAAGLVRVQHHPEFELSIYNYSDACVWESQWSPVTLACRGLIVEDISRRVVARPYPKFFNHGQLEAPELGLDEEVVVMDKADGSLGILFPLPGEHGYAVATRGSFASEQAQWATRFFQRVYADVFSPNPAWTYLFEIVYPENRVVLDYGDTEDLILLGAVEIASGRSIHVEEAQAGWPGPTVDIFPHTSLREV